ncbi:DUF2642 domain-containing protein [Brevibacillus ginsengisoli]|uniref:DUF2642 domain-containing protein n=1 Tax=Brevibacillus ginsengisoli TaxID=363854 RepID=UPI003CF3DEB2
MNFLDQFLYKQVFLELSGKTKHTGILIDYGNDILVLFNGQDYFYFPLMQVQNLNLNRTPDPKLVLPDNSTPSNDQDRISFRKILLNAKGMFVKIYVTGNQTIHGYVLNVLNDYFLFNSPVYKTMSIAMHHLKWLVPYTQNVTPYTLNNQNIPFSSMLPSTSRTFEEQLKRLEGSIVVFDIGDHPYKIGLLKKVASNSVIIVDGDGDETYWNLQHLKTVHTP